MEQKLSETMKFGRTVNGCDFKVQIYLEGSITNFSIAIRHPAVNWNHSNVLKVFLKTQP